VKDRVVTVHAGDRFLKEIPGYLDPCLHTHRLGGGESRKITLREQ